MESLDDMVAPLPAPKPPLRVRAGCLPEEDAAIQEAFVDEYMKDLNGVAAVRRLCLGTKQPLVLAYKLKRSGYVKMAIAARMEDFREQGGITEYRVLDEYAKIAFFDPKKLFDGDGIPLPIHDLDERTAAAISGLDVVESSSGHAVTKKYKLSDKKSALDSLAKHMGMFTEKVEITGKEGEPIEFMDHSPNDIARRLAFLLQKGIHP